MKSKASKIYEDDVMMNAFPSQDMMDLYKDFSISLEKFIEILNQNQNKKLRFLFPLANSTENNSGVVLDNVYIHDSKVNISLIQKKDSSDPIQTTSKLIDKLNESKGLNDMSQCKFNPMMYLILDPTSKYNIRRKAYPIVKLTFDGQSLQFHLGKYLHKVYIDGKYSRSYTYEEEAQDYIRLEKEYDKRNNQTKRYQIIKQIIIR